MRITLNRITLPLVLEEVFPPTPECSIIMTSDVFQVHNTSHEEHFDEIFFEVVYRQVMKKLDFTKVLMQ